MTIIAEKGTRVIDGWIEVSEDSPMEEDVLYEFRYEVRSLPLPIPWINWFRAKMVDIFLGLQEKFRGVDIVYYRFTDEDLVFQAVGHSKSPVWQEIALSAVAIACSGLFLVAGIYLIFTGVSKGKTIPFTPSWWEKLSTFGRGLLAGAGLLAIGLVIWGAKKKK